MFAGCLHQLEVSQFGKIVYRAMLEQRIMNLSKVMLDVDIRGYEIEKTYQRNERPCLFDSIREILVVITPEEIIRQKFMQYLISVLNVPYCDDSLSV